MTVTIGVNDDNDIFINSSGNLDMQTGIIATLQACAQISKAQLREMIYAQQEGIPNFETLWVGVPNLAQWEAAVRSNILEVEGVINILNFTTSLANNVLSYTIEILTVYGSGLLTENIASGVGGSILIGEDGLPIYSESGQPIMSV